MVVERTSSWVRPEGVPLVHFSCDGSLLLLRKVSEQVRVGDTASASVLSGRCWLFRFTELVARPNEGRSLPVRVWVPLEPWSREVAPKYVNAADLVVVLLSPATSVPGALLPRRYDA